MNESEMMKRIEELEGCLATIRILAVDIKTMKNPFVLQVLKNRDLKAEILSKIDSSLNVGG
jgi:hypothetical protein